LRRGREVPLVGGAGRCGGDFKDVHAAIRRCVLPNGEISDDASSAAAAHPDEHHGDARYDPEESAADFALAECRSRRRLRYAAERSFRDSRAGGTPAEPAGRGARASATGQTVFMEPFETVEPNNQLVQLAEDEAAEIVRILRELTGKLQMIRAPLLAANRTIAELDSVFARARFARDFDAAMPEFSARNELRLEGARHPVLEDKLRKENRTIVPMTLALGGEERVLVISGPNTGGKTVALKTTGMAALAAQSGIQWPPGARSCRCSTACSWTSATSNRSPRICPPSRRTC